MNTEVSLEEMSDNDMLKGLTQSTFISNETIDSEVSLEEMSDNDMWRGLTQNTFYSYESTFTTNPDNVFVFEDEPNKNIIDTSEKTAANFNITVSKEVEDSGFFEDIAGILLLDRKLTKSVCFKPCKKRLYFQENCPRPLYLFF